VEGRPKESGFSITELAVSMGVLAIIIGSIFFYLKNSKKELSTLGKKVAALECVIYKAMEKKHSCAANFVVPTGGLGLAIDPSIGRDGIKKLVVQEEVGGALESLIELNNEGITKISLGEFNQIDTIYILLEAVDGQTEEKVNGKVGISFIIDGNEQISECWADKKSPLKESCQ
jgi:hypothetical protein